MSDGIYVTFPQVKNSPSLAGTPSSDEERGKTDYFLLNKHNYEKSQICHQCPRYFELYVSYVDLLSCSTRFYQTNMLAWQPTFIGARHSAFIEFWKEGSHKRSFY